MDNRLKEYKEVELIRRSVRDVQKRGQELDKLRKMQGAAYDGVKSKVARNIKVVNRVNKERAARGEIKLDPVVTIPRGYTPMKTRRPATSVTMVDSTTNNRVKKGN